MNRIGNAIIAIGMGLASLSTYAKDPCDTQEAALSRVQSSVSIACQNMSPPLDSIGEDKIQAGINCVLWKREEVDALESLALCRVNHGDKEYGDDPTVAKKSIFMVANDMRSELNTALDALRAANIPHS